jgi:hypothetical protein
VRKVFQQMTTISLVDDDADAAPHKTINDIPVELIMEQLQLQDSINLCIALKLSHLIAFEHSQLHQGKVDIF